MSQKTDKEKLLNEVFNQANEPDHDPKEIRENWLKVFESSGALDTDEAKKWENIFNRNGGSNNDKDA